MRESGSFVIPAPQSEVWSALQDPHILQECIEGCESMVNSSKDTFDAVVRAKIGPIRANFTVRILMLNKRSPEAYTLDLSAQGTAGFGNGRAKVELSEIAQGTKLEYQVEGNVGGKIAQLGSRLVQAVGRKYADQFFARFSARWKELNSSVISNS